MRDRLTERAREVQIDTPLLVAVGGDWNSDASELPAPIALAGLWLN